MNFIGTKEIETERLLLRRLTVFDAPYAFKKWCNDEDVCKYTLWKKHESEEDTKELFKMWEEEYNDLKTFRWIVEIKDTNEIIGTIDVVSRKFFEFGTFEIGYCYGKDYWNKGYATEALKAVISYLFEKVGAETIYLEHLSKNMASGRVMEKAGLTKEGIFRSRIIDKDGYRNDLISYSITREEYFSNVSINTTSNKYTKHNDFK